MLFSRRRPQHKSEVPVAVATPAVATPAVTSNHTTCISVTATAPGYNKNLRDTTKLALLISAFLLLGGWTLPSFFLSMIACCVIHNGTFASIKNWQWTGASWFSLVCSGMASFDRWCMGIIDQEKAYSLYLMFYIGARGCELCGGVMLLFWLFLAVTSTR
jgi:hypothetical protein